ncbi:MAG: NADH-quinone oxidoreductase subunit C [Clostridiales Family XIII bacterium]|jgi:ech hydrogenase subunit D|nr:NADH-quinone oxidoreductase subunit C [Clostridiales Family XIII bacterium]
MAERKDLIQDIQAIEASNLLASAADIKSAGYRLGQACATKTEGGIEVLYSFEKDETLKNLKVRIKDKDPELQSLTGIYWPAFIYENEMHDLFGITFKNLALDYGGHFFKIASETPWNPVDKRGAAEAEEAAPEKKDDVKAAEKDATPEEKDDVKAAEKEAAPEEKDDVKAAEKEKKPAKKDAKAAKKEVKPTKKETKAAGASDKTADAEAANSDKNDEKGGEA